MGPSPELSTLTGKEESAQNPKLPGVSERIRQHLRGQVRGNRVFVGALGAQGVLHQLVVFCISSSATRLHVTIGGFQGE